MILAFDTSTAACTAALFDESGRCLARTDEMIGRGHAERLVPMLAELLHGRRAEQILVGVGPGSFTGIRVGIAAAHGLAIGWDAEVHGVSSLGLLAASAAPSEDVAAAMLGGHGEIFVQPFDRRIEPTADLANLSPLKAAAVIRPAIAVGSGAAALIEARGWGEARECWPSAAVAMTLPKALRSLPAKPIYAREPDARAREAA